MVVDSSLTNIFVVNGVSQIRYRVYAQNYSRSTLLLSLKSPHDLYDLIWAFRNLRDRRIPCTWRVSSKSTETRSQTTDQVRVELWVFWFDERRTGEIDAHQGLSVLEEVRMGSFTWESVTKGRTAKSSPNLNSKRPRALVAVTEEYKVFMQALKNLLHASLIRTGSVPLGDFYINSHYTSQSDSVVGCAYNAYLTGSDLVFQPYTRRLRLRAFAPAIDQGSRVILSPSGEHAVVVSASIELDTTAKEIARQWSLLFEMPQLEKSSLVCIRTKRITVFYPSDLIFVAQPLRNGSRLMAGMESTLRENRGHVHDIGQLWCMGMDEQVAASLRRSAIDALIAADGKSASSVTAKGLLQRMLEQPIVYSPIMAAKTIGTPPHALSPLSVASPKDSRPSDSEASTISTSLSSGTLGKASSLLDYAIKNFSAINNDEPKPYMPIDIMENIDTNQSGNPSSTTSTPIPPKTDTEDQPEVEQLLYGGLDDSFPVLEMPRQWDNAMDVDDFDNFNLDVTEEDFDFFESTPTRAPLPPPPATAERPAHEATEGTVAAPTVSASGDSSDIMPPTVDFNAIMPASSAIPEVEMLDTKFEPSDLSTAMDIDTPAAPSLPEFAAPVVKSETEEPGHTSPNISEMTAIASSDASATAFHDSPTQMYRTIKEEQELVPQGFTPIRFSTGVDDAKYLGGGKFMYSEDTKSAQPEVYRPDYKPPLTRRLEEAAARRKAEEEDDQDDEDDSSSSDSGSNSDDDSDTSSAEDSSDLSSISSDEHKNDPAGALGEAQMIFVRRLLRDIRNQPKRHRVNHLTLDYDSPFSSIQSIQPQKMIPEDLASLDYLCRQTVWGAYPFTGDPYENAFSSSPDCAQGESIQVIVDRQRTLVQSLRGDITHVPCLASDSAHTMHDFKNALLDVFDEQDLPEAPALAEHTLVDVKGPLSIQQYYELAETSQPHSKYYGKYQVKKRKSVDPNLSNLQYPDIIVGQKEEWLEGSPEMLNYWEKLHLEPYSCKNDIQYIVLYPGSNEYMGPVVRGFFQNLSAVYEACSLGTHHAGRLNPHHEGACVPVIPTEDHAWFQSYISACEAVAASLAEEALNPNMRTVIYLINPSSSRLSATFDLSRCFHHLITTYRSLITKAGVRHDNDHIVMQLVPLEHVLRSSAYTMQGFKDVAFSVYRQCRVPSQKQQHLQMYTPPWVLAEPFPEKVQLDIKNPLVTRPQVVQDTSATIHVAYTFSLDRRWMVAVWTDNRGTTMDFSVLEIQTDTMIGSPLAGVFKETWRRTKHMAEGTGLNWNYVIAKMGLIFEGELQVWVDIVEGEDKVAIVSLDIESPFYCSLSLPDTETSSSNMNNNNPNIADITPPAAATAAAAQRAGPYDAPVAQLIVLNHRVGYSRRRVEAYQGNLAMDSVHSELEGWILSLATGYLIQEPCPSTDTLHKASTIELHLVYNQNTQTPYTTVHRILQQYHGLCFVNQLPSTLVRKARIPSHLATVERLCRLLLVIGS